MRTVCSHCQNPVELGVDHPTRSAVCPACGGTLTAADPDRTATFREPTGRLVGRFELVGLLGSGSFGDVWEAYDAQLDRRVALKLPRKEALSAAEVDRFLREARVAAQLQHPNVVRVHDAGRTGDTVYIVSELVAGVNLSDWLTVRRPTPREAAALCATLADALHHAHQAGVVHRDLKPGNVLMDGAGVPHLTDFGLAKRDGAELTMTVAGHVFGTPAYMSPEQARGDARNADRRSDVYSLGVMLYEMLVGARPFQGVGKPLLVHQVLHQDPAPPRRRNRAVPRDLETVCLKALEKDPARRYPTAEAMGDDLRCFLDGRPVRARRASWVERGWRRARRNPAAAGLATLALALALVTAGLVWRALGPAPGPAPDPGREVTLATTPAGARVAFVPLDPDTGLPVAGRAVRPPGLSPVAARLPPGRYLVVAAIDGRGFHEVYRTVPAPADDAARGPYRHQRWEVDAGGRVDLEPVPTIPVTSAVTRDLVEFAGGEFDVGRADDPLAPRHRRAVAPFWLAPHEVTVGEYRRVVGATPQAHRQYATLKDDDHPLTHVSYSAALEYAELAGLRLPTEFEYEFAATAGGTRRFPWGDDPTRMAGWPFGPVGTPGFDVTPPPTPVFGLYSGVAELTDSVWTAYPGAPPLPPAVRELNRQSRIVRGGPMSVAEGKPAPAEWTVGPTHRHAIDVERHLPGLGFRCARSAAPRFLAGPGAE